MTSTAIRLQQRLRPHFPCETVEAYPRGGRQPGHRLVIVSKQFEGVSPERRTRRIQGILRDFIGTKVLRTPAEVKEEFTGSPD